MCTLCDVTQNFDPARHDGASPSFAALTETSDAAASTSTSYAMSVGDTFSGSIGASGDNDWIEVQLQAGQTYTFDLQGAPSGSGTLADPYLVLRDGSGNQLTYNDDGGSSYESRLTYTAQTTGSYYLNARAYGSTQQGTYLLSMAEAEAPEAGTVDEMATFLLSGYWGSERSFDTSNDNTITVNLTALTAEGQQLARWALEAWETVANLDFVEVNSGGDITFDDNDSGAYASSVFANGVTQSSHINVSTSWLNSYGSDIASYSMSTYVHEIGHALGLGHQGGYNGSASYPNDATFLNDSYQLSVMSYFSQTENGAVHASYGQPITAMMVDIVAIQQHYGAPGDTSPSAGDTIWGEASTLGTYLDQLMTNGALPSDPVVITIYDVGGTDLLNLASHGHAATIDLTPESFSSIGGGNGNLAIARDTYIENVTLGAGNDTVTGNTLANLITTQGGDDSIHMGDGNDTGNGGDGADWIAGMSGDDLLSGSTGTDTLFGGVGQDVLVGGADTDLLAGGDGLDTLWGGTGHDQLFGGVGNDLLAGGGGHDTLRGGAGDDALFGGTENDLLVGGEGLDTLSGGTGNDELFGGAESDALFGGDGWDELYGGAAGDQLSGGNGYDALFGGTGNDTLLGGNHNDQLDGGAENDRLEGGAGIDVLNGGTGDDTLIGGTGNDRLSDAQGNDVMEGGTGADGFWIGSGADTVSGGGGADTFHFFRMSGTDVITDLSAAEGDLVRLHANLWATSGTLTEAQMLSQFASLNGDGNVVLSFDTGDNLTLTGITSLTGLGDVVDII